MALGGGWKVGDRNDPYLCFNFVVEIEGLAVAGFSEVSGLQIEIEVEAFREGGVNEYMHQIAGPAKYGSNLVLKRGITGDDTLWQWHQDVVHGIIERKNGSVLLCDSAGQETWRWNFIDAYPVKWSGPEMNAGSAQIAIESVELAHRGLMKAS
jgi:phage tail-like protein